MLCLDTHNQQSLNSEKDVWEFYLLLPKHSGQLFLFLLIGLLIDCEVLDVWQYLSKFNIIYFGKNKKVIATICFRFLFKTKKFINF